MRFGRTERRTTGERPQELRNAVKSSARTHARITDPHSLSHSPLPAHNLPVSQILHVTDSLPSSELPRCIGLSAAIDLSVQVRHYVLYDTMFTSLTRNDTSYIRGRCIPRAARRQMRLGRNCDLRVIVTRSSAVAEGPRDASCQSKSCQLPRNSAETTCTTSPVPSISCR